MALPYPPGPASPYPALKPPTAPTAGQAAAAGDPFQGAFNGVTGAITVPGPLPDMSINLKPIQQFLISRGYKITATGKADNLTKSALADFLNPADVGNKLGLLLKGTTITGKRNPTNWNISRGLATGDMKGGYPNPNANVPAGLNGKGGKGGGSATDPFAALAKMAGGVGQMLPSSLAQLIAGGTYDPVIADLSAQIAKLPGQTKQNKADITNWMNQVLSSLASGTKASDAGYTAAGNSAVDSAQGIAASLGGSDNPGVAGSLGATGAQAQDLFSALKGNQDSFSGNMNSILGLEKDAQLQSQDNQGQDVMRQLMAQLSGAQGQKAGLSASTQMQIDQANSATQQQRFQNLFGISQAQSAQQIASGQNALNNAYKFWQTANLKAKVLGGGKPSSGTFGGTSAKSLGTIAQGIYGAIKNLQTNDPNMPTSQIVNMVNNMIGSTFPNDNLGNGKLAAWRNHIFALLGINPATQ